MRFRYEISGEYERATAYIQGLVDGGAARATYFPNGDKYIAIFSLEPNVDVKTIDNTMRVTFRAKRLEPKKLPRSRA